MESEKENDWFQLKSYLHFSPKITKQDFDWAKEFVSSEKKIKTYSFYPLIHRVIIQRRYKKLTDGKRSHFDSTKKESTAKERQIYYANHLDTLIYAYYTKVKLEPKYEGKIKEIDGLSNCISAYRTIKVHPNTKSGKSNIHFANDVFNCIKQYDECAVLTFDIEKFFDSLNHQHLKKAWCNLLNSNKLPDDHYNIYKSLTNFSFVEESELLNELGLLNIGNRFEIKRIIKNKNIKSYCKNNKEFRLKVCGRENKKCKSLVKPHPFEYKKNQIDYLELKSYKKRHLKGIPQGTAISAFLANLYLLEFDTKVFNEVTNFEGIYRRYSDDIVIVCKLKDETHLKNFVINAIEDYKLIINKDKTEVSYFKRNLNKELVLDKDSMPLRYLGFEFNGLTIRIKSASIAKYYRKMKSLIKFKALRSSFLQKKKSTIHTQIHKKKIYKRYSHLGNLNFIAYAYKASKIINGNSIKSQLKRHWRNLNNYITFYEEKYKLPKR
ncbi:antiviral reverse transcriptase Drt2 [Runella slithyformis]|uniref:RNA-directed DNA polymerase (Reverse transcriptase) n=1 Tax=Runella slithyformis (strain ATCC 29530 / DSM 19594 / LMG 11500 / NCIMB 11436 / LSU 4) TaxID=761193 RepID=A0A7U3ZLZ8_RUNSL|nr:antiviral reverse transcriptase Drt2 [Runella slithyformis]AEI49677.1 RNA-directed DNA polymerase (Reverse transcriptase) [Runella slithyformis DSM 19594]